MKTSANPALDEREAITGLPRWVASVRKEDTETVVFSSGAALAILDEALRDPKSVSVAPLLRDRLALEAAAACLMIEGRGETTSDIRDAICLARAGGCVWTRGRDVCPLAQGCADASGGIDLEG